MKTIKRLKNNCVSKIYVSESASNFVLSSRGEKVPSLKIMRFSMFSRFTFEQLQWIILATEKSLSEQCEGGLKCCVTGKFKELSRIERMCSVILSANLRPVSPI